MPTDAPLTPAIAITLAVIAVLAFVGVLVSLALGSIAAAGTCGLILVVLWFVVRVLQRRG